MTWTINDYFGQEQPDRREPRGPDGHFRIFDTYITYRPSRALSLGIDVNRVTNEITRGGAVATFSGLAAYARYQYTAPAAFAVRYDHLDDGGGLFGGIEQPLQEVTLTGEYRLANGFLVRAEFRRDRSNRDCFTGSRHDLRRSAQTTALVGLVWWAGGKKGAW